MAEQTRSRGVVGRDREIEVFERIVAADTPHRGLFLHGPGGVGKTVLLGELSRRCSRSGFDIVLLDAARLGRSREAVLEALRQGFGLGDGDDLADALADRRPAIAIDSVEYLESIEEWLVGELIASLPAETLILLAGRRRLSPAARALLTWQTAVRPLTLRNFARAESDAFLTRLQVPSGLHPALFRLTTGQPLALALIAEVALEQGTEGLQTLDSLRIDHFPNIVSPLLAHWMRDLPAGRSYRGALRVCALALFTTQDVLRGTLDLAEEQAAATFDWLQGRSFVKTTPQGLVQHQIVRQAIAADLRWRDPPRYLELVRRLAGHTADSLATLSERDLDRAVKSFMHVIHSPAGYSGFLDHEGLELAEPVPAADGDWVDIERIVERFDGSASLELLRWWRGSTL